MKKLISIILCLTLVLGLATVAFAATETKAITYDFTNLEVGSEITDNALDVFNAATTDTQLVSVTTTKVYAGSNGGAHNGEAGYVKTGTGSAAGQIVLTYAEGVKVTKVDIYCHDWYAKSADYPTNSNYVSVNGSDEVLAPYNETGACEALSFDLTATNVVTMDFNKRVWISKIVVYTEVEVENTPTETTAPSDETTDPSEGTTAPVEPETPPQTGDMVSVIVALMTVAAAGAVVISKKKF